MLRVRTRLAISAIHGFGLLADQPIAKETLVWQFVPAFDLTLPALFVRHLAMLNPEFFERYAWRCPDSGHYRVCSDDARFLNHADEPNLTNAAGCLFAGQAIRTTDQLVAVRDIESGEELTVDYRIGDADPWRGFNKEEAKHESAGSASVTIGHAGMADHGQFADGRDHANARQLWR